MRECIEYRLSVIVVEDASSLAKASLIGTTIESLACICIYVNCKNKTYFNGKSCFLSIHYSFNPVELVCKLESVLILVFGIPVKNRVLLVQWKKLGEFVLSL